VTNVSTLRCVQVIALLKAVIEVLETIERNQKQIMMRQIHLERNISQVSSLLVDRFLQLFIGFLPARRYASAGLCDSNVSVRPSVRPSVCLSHAGIVPSRAKAGS